MSLNITVFDHETRGWVDLIPSRKPQAKLTTNLEAKWLRIDFSWSQMEPEKGIWRFEKYDTYLEKAVKEGVKVLAISVWGDPLGGGLPWGSKDNHGRFLWTGM